MKKQRAAVMIGLVAMILYTGGCSAAAGKAVPQKTAQEESSGVSQGVPETAAGESGKGSGRSGEDSETARETAVLDFKEQEMVDAKLLKECEEFASLSEGYVENASFVTAEDGQAEMLAKLLSGHYEVAGRKGDDGQEYYMAVRRSDAPVYGDFKGLSVGYVYYADSMEEVCQIGYYDENGKETVLYEISGFLVEGCMDREEEKALDLFCLIPESMSEDGAFLCAFQESGRKKLEFIGKHQGLSYHKEGQNCIDFYYQDEDTLEFCWEPYSCCISLDEKECEKIRAFLENGQDQKQEFANHSETIEWLRKENPSVRTTGAVLNLDGSFYEILGSRDSGGYMIGRNGDMVCWLKSEEQIYSYVLDRIADAVGKDYGAFTDTWFDGGLVKASLVFPRKEEGEDGTWTREVCRQTITEADKLEHLAKLLGRAIQGHEAISGCPYVGVLDLERENGETLQMFVAADSCDSITYDGRIGFEYGKQEELAEIFDEAMR